MHQKHLETSKSPAEQLGTHTKHPEAMQWQDYSLSTEVEREGGISPPEHVAAPHPWEPQREDGEQERATGASDAERQLGSQASTLQSWKRWQGGPRTKTYDAQRKERQTAQEEATCSPNRNGCTRKEDQRREATEERGPSTTATFQCT